jgi:hypothetical protein
MGEEPKIGRDEPVLFNKCYDKRRSRGAAVNSGKIDESGGERGLYRQKEKRRLLKLEELYERHGQSLYRHLVFRLSSAEDAKDVLQET